jgi:TatD DNase family protein
VSSKERDRTYPPLPEPLPGPVVDNHTHIEPFQHFPETELALDQQVELAAAVGVSRIVQCGCDLEAARWTVAEAVANPAVVGAIAVHPNEAPRLEARTPGGYQAGLAEIETLARNSRRVRAIGETGLDYFRTAPEGREQQRRAFRDHIALAKELDLAMQIHDRDAHQDVIDILLADGAPERTVFHCYSGDVEMAQILKAHGWYASFAGTVTFKNAEGLRAAVATLPPELVLVETDAPYLTPEPYRGRPNAPFMVALTMRTVAERMGLALAAACTQVWDNTERVYGAW